MLFVLVKLLENNDLSIDNNVHINNILNNYYKILFGEKYDCEITDIQFQAIINFNNSIMKK